MTLPCAKGHACFFSHHNKTRTIHVYTLPSDPSDFHVAMGALPDDVTAVLTMLAGKEITP